MGARVSSEHGIFCLHRYNLYTKTSTRELTSGTPDAEQTYRVQSTGHPTGPPGAHRGQAHQRLTRSLVCADTIAATVPSTCRDATSPPPARTLARRNQRRGRRPTANCIGTYGGFLTFMIAACPGSWAIARTHTGSVRWSLSSGLTVTSIRSQDIYRGLVVIVVVGSPIGSGSVVVSRPGPVFSPS